MKNLTSIIWSLVGVAALIAIVLVILSAFFGINFVTQPVFGTRSIFDTSDSTIYAKPQNKGCMTFAGTVNYCQTGKPNEVKYTGIIPLDKTLDVTGYTVQFEGETSSQGVVKTITGPYDLNKSPLVVRDGAATLTDSGDATQKKLDSMWVDFCRGDRRSDGLWWSYQPWALSVVEVEDYYFPQTTAGCFKEDGDIYPSFLVKPQSSKVSSAVQSASHNRKTTGDGGTLTFEKGSTVCGVTIKLQSGKEYSGCVSNTPTGGTVFQGVIWPWDTELHDVLNLSK